MAVISTKATTRIGLSLKTGVDAKGNEVKKTMNLSKIKVTATDDNLFATAKAIEPLLRYQVVGIEKNDVYQLGEE